MHLSKARLNEKLFNAIQNFYEQEFDLLTLDVSERAITHRLAIHIEKEFPGWNVDCEYNRYYDTVKKIRDNENPCKTDDSSDEYKSVYPDIIVHKRNSDCNFLVIELKKENNPVKDECDLYKLQQYKGDLHYKFGVFIRLRMSRAVSLEDIKEMVTLV